MASEPDALAERVSSVVTRNPQVFASISSQPRPANSNSTQEIALLNSEFTQLSRRARCTVPESIRKRGSRLCKRNMDLVTCPARLSLPLLVVRPPALVARRPSSNPPSRSSCPRRPSSLARPPSLVRPPSRPSTHPLPLPVLRLPSLVRARGGVLGLPGKRPCHVTPRWRPGPAPSIFPIASLTLKLGAQSM